MSGNGNLSQNGYGQLSTLLGKKVQKVRKTDEASPRISVIDVASAITGKNASHTSEDIRRLFANYPEVHATGA